MTYAEILGHIVKYKLPSIQGSFTWHRSQLQNLLIMVEKFGMPHFEKTLTTNKMTSTRWPKFNDMEYLIKQIHKNMSWNFFPAYIKRQWHFRQNKRICYTL